MPVQWLGIQVRGGLMDLVVWQDPVTGHHTIQRLDVVADDGRRLSIEPPFHPDHRSLRAAIDHATALAEASLSPPTP